MLLKNAKTLSQIKNVGFTFDDREKCRPFERKCEWASRSLRGDL